MTEIEALRDTVDQLKGAHGALHAAVVSLFATHPNQQQLHLHFVSMTEIMIAGMPQLSERGKGMARLTAESLQQVKPIGGRIDPLAGHQAPS